VEFVDRENAEAVAAAAPATDTFGICSSSALKIDTAYAVKNGAVFDGSTQNEPNTELDACGNIEGVLCRGFSYEVPVWIHGIMTALTCDDLTASDTSVAVYKGSCNKLGCVAGQLMMDCVTMALLPWRARLAG